MLTPRDLQIIQTHAAFICDVVKSAHNPDAHARLGQLLDSAAQSGWQALVQALRLIVAGHTDLSGIAHLDDEDRVIAEAILRGLQNPATLPDPNKKPEARLAAPGLAAMIHAAATGDMQALVLLGQMGEQMSRAGGDMARIAGAIRPLINGERDPDTLGRDMDDRGRLLLHNILEELDILEQSG